MSNDLVDQKTAWPTRKLGWATIGGMAAAVASDIAVANIPAISTVNADELQWLVVGAATMGVGYFVRDRDNT